MNMHWWMFLVFIAVAWSVMFGMHWLVYSTASRVFDFLYCNWLPLLAVLSASYLLASVGVRTVGIVVADWFYFVAATWLGIIFLFFSVTVVYELVHLVTGFESRVFLGGLLLLAVVASVYGLFNGRYITTKEYSLGIDGLADSVRIVHLSDIHVGTVHQTKYLQEVVEKTNALNPDLVFVTGDLFDGSAPIEEDILMPLNDLEAPSFFSNGNHEEYEGLARVKETIANLDMQLLDNQMVEQGNLQIIGVNDRQSIPRAQTLGSILEGLDIQEEKFTILMYHTPVEWEDARANNIDLMLSGHTHNGQIYPFNLLVRAFFKYVQGVYEEEGRYLHVSPGTGTWGPPMRLGSRNQITLLKLEPK